MPELFCQLGNHTWTREPQRGKPPHNCPLHKPLPSLSKARRGAPTASQGHVHVEPAKPSTARIEGISAILDARTDCTCHIEPEYTDRQLMKTQSCKPEWVCSTLDKIRRAYVTYT
jgi:hypothetical protein